MQVENYNNDKIDGVSKSYLDDGRIHSERLYSNGNLISGKCSNGRAWTEAELENWNNGLEVECQMIKPKIISLGS